MSAIIVATMIIKRKAADSVHSMEAKCILLLVWLKCVQSLMIRELPVLLWILYQAANTQEYVMCASSVASGFERLRKPGLSNIGK